MSFDDDEVEQKFSAYPRRVGAELLRLRDMVLEVASDDPRIGPLEESLKWGQLAYRPKRARVGTTVRMDARGDETVALFYHCQSNLGEQIDALYGNVLDMDHRSISISVANPPDQKVLRHCIQMALTYHLNR